MKKLSIIKSAVNVMLFLAALGLALFTFYQVFQFKHADGIYNLKKFYELEDNTVDVLVLGSSHSFADINTGALWDEYGMASFDLGGAQQPIWNSYYYLKEALKTQTPKVIVLEGFKLVDDEEYAESSVTIKSLYGMRWSEDKIEAIKASVDPEDWASYFLDYSQFHSRYTELTKADFAVNQGDKRYENWKGFVPFHMTGPLPRPDVSAVDKRTPMTEKVEYYYRATLELAKEAGIPICVVVSPYQGIKENEQEIYNYASDIAKEYDVPFLNYNLMYDEIGLDFETDVAEYSHLNYLGSLKFSKALGEYLMTNYNVPDRRGNNTWASWQADADWLRKDAYNRNVKVSYNFEILFKLLKEEKYTLLIAVDEKASKDTVKLVREGLGFKEISGDGIFVYENGQLLATVTGKEEKEDYLYLDGHDVQLIREYDKENKKFENVILFDKEAYERTPDGINLIIYDEVSGAIVTAYGIDLTKQEYCIVETVQKQD